MTAQSPRPRLVLALGLFSTFVGMGHGAWSQPASQGADLILIHGAVSTPSGWAQALAIRGGVIVAVGDTPTIEPLASPGAKCR